MHKVAGFAAAATLALPAPAVAAVNVKQFAALAYSPLKVRTVFVGYSNALPAAKAAVLKLCQKYEKGCRGATWVQNGWTAYASVPGPRGGVGFAYGASASFADNVAMHWCLATQNSAPKSGPCTLRAVISTTPLNTRKVRGGTW